MSTVNLENKTILVTGAAGFIGSNLVKRIYQETSSATVIGIDNMNTYYDVALKEFRLEELTKYSSFIFVKGNIADKALITDVFEKYRPSVVVNLAAQAGVRYSITNPDAYVESNLVGFFNILEACRHNPVEHLVYASSSSVYGSNKKVPYSTSDKVDNPVSLYAATKKSNELMAHAYSKLYNIPSTGDMSIIGTRPPLISETNLYELHHRARLAIKPGITGMWQVSGRSDITDFEEVVRLDKEYITNWNIGLDIKILFKTVLVVFKKDGSM